MHCFSRLQSCQNGVGGGAWWYVSTRIVPVEKFRQEQQPLPAWWKYQFFAFDATDAWSIALQKFAASTAAVA